MLTETYNFSAETHLGAGGTSVFVFLSVAIAQPLTSTFIGIIALRKAHEDSDYTGMIATC